MRRAYAPKFSAMEATEFEEEPPILIRKAPPRPRFPQPVLLHLPPSPVPSAAVVVAPGTPVQPGWISMAAPMGAMTSVAACGVQPFETAVCADGLGRVALKLRADLDEALKVAPTGFGADSAEVAPPLETTAELENPRCPETPALCGEEGRAPARLRAEVAECREATASALDLRCRPSVATWMKQPLAAVAAGCGTPAEDPCGAHKVRRVRFQAEGAPEGADMKYYGQDSLRAALSGGDVRLIRGDWLAQLHRKGGRRARVPRCQDLPADAFWRLEDEPWTAQIIAVSYCWATTEHPDPQGEQFFQYIGPLLDKYLAMYGQLALFWDWCSLPQEPRTEEETARFQRALDSAPLWYAHNATIIWMLTRPPDGVKDYSERGWPCFERAVCTLINCVARVLDLGALHGADWQSGSYADIEWKCRIKRRPPEPPPDFAGTLKGRRFAKKEDRHFVALKYEETFREIMGSVHNMDCKKLGWDDEDVCKLSQCLLVCMNLRKLKLRDNKIVDISALCEWLIGGGGSNLQTLDLSRNCIEDVTAMRAALTTGGSNIDYLSFWDNLIVDVTPLGEALAEDICLRELHLDKNKVFDVIPLGAALATNTTLQHLNLRSNCIQDIAALARGVAGNTGLQTLTLDDNQVTDVSVLGACLAQNQGLESLSLKTNHVMRRDACAQLLEAALEISPDNASVEERAKRLTKRGAAGAVCNMSAKSQHSVSLTESGPTLQIGPILGWDGQQPSSGAECSPEDLPTGSTAQDLYATPLGFVHISELGLKNWTRTLRLFGAAAKRRFKQVRQSAKQRRGESRFVDVNNFFFKNQDTNPDEAVRRPQNWKELYSSPEYAEWSDVTKGICTSFIRKMGIPLSEEEERSIEAITWAAVYPTAKKDVVTHYYHAHQESIVSFVLYVSMPSPTTPLTVSDPRGAPPIEDFEWFQGRGDLGVDSEPPFHRPVEFFAGEGDIFVFPSFAIHKVPPHIGNGTRVVFPSNCHLPKTRHKFGNMGGFQSPLDGWERIARWSVGGWPSADGARPTAVEAYDAHLTAVLSVAQGLEDPYMKMWEAQNQVVGMLQFAPHDAPTWMRAGNASAHIAVILDSRGEGEYYSDAAVQFARALQLDPGIKPKLDALFAKEFQNVPKRLAEQYGNVRQWMKLIQSWRASPPSLELGQFLHPEINGPGKCKRMCPSSVPPKYTSLRILPVFAVRIHAFPLKVGRSPADEIRQVAKILLGGLPEELVDVVSVALPHAGRWRTAEEASLTAVVCEAAGEAVWFGDPRGQWPERWDGAVPADGDVLGVEPKAPFHWHSAAHCSGSHEALIFPGWLAHQFPPYVGKTSSQIFDVVAGDGSGGVVGWRLPRPPLLCSDAAQAINGVRPRSRTEL